MSPEKRMNTKSGRPLICISLAESSPDKAIQVLKKLADEHKASQDIIFEIRADSLVCTYHHRHTICESLTKINPEKTIFTFRVSDTPEHISLELYNIALENKVSFVDVEYNLGPEFISKIIDMRNRLSPHSKIIVSSHEFSGTPSKKVMTDTMTLMSKTGADVIKYAALAIKDTDPFDLIEASSEFENTDKVIISMGEKGKFTRILASQIGSILTYVSLPLCSKPSAPGQLTLDEAMNIFNIAGISSETRILGIIGNPISHSLSPLIHNRALQHHNIDAVFIPFLAQDFVSFLASLQESRFGSKLIGLSVTSPFKRCAADFCTKLTKIAEETNSVNTLLFSQENSPAQHNHRYNNRKVQGYNTDGLGALDALHNNLKLIEPRNDKKNPFENLNTLVIGAGGAAQTMAHALHSMGSRVFIANRTTSKAESIAEKLNIDVLKISTISKDTKVLSIFDIIINCTPVGMSPNIESCPLPESAINTISSKTILMDMIYDPPETKLMRLAKPHAALVLNGLTMLIKQASRQFSIWSGVAMEDLEFTFRRISSDLFEGGKP